MLVSEIATRVKRQFGDEVGAQITDSDIIRWINDAQAEIAVNNNLLQVAANSNTVVGQSAYVITTIASNMLTLRGIRYNNVKLQGISPEEADQQVLIPANLGNGTPQKFSIFAGTVTLYPAPDSVLQLSVLFTRTPVQVAVVGDTPELPLAYHNRIVEYCIAQAAESDDDLSHHQLKMGQFKSGIDALKDNSSWTEQDFYPSITAGPADTYFDYEPIN
jgi:hypothetical protein